MMTTLARQLHKLAEASALLGGLVLIALALLMTLSIIGGALSHLFHSEWLSATLPMLAEFGQASGVRTIPGMYEVMAIGIAFVLFAFLPIAQLHGSHAVVDLFAARLPKRIGLALIAFWELLLLFAMMVIIWRLWLGMERLMSAGVHSQDLQIPQWWGYAVACLQMLCVCLIGALRASICCADVVTGSKAAPSSSNI